MLRPRPPSLAATSNWCTRTIVLYFFGVQEILPFLSRGDTTLAVVLAQDPMTCDIRSDIFDLFCPYVFDGVCDSSAGGVCPQGTDCADCEGCFAYKLDCQGCVANGCYYCPSDGMCQSQALGPDVWAVAESLPGAKVSSCWEEVDWVQTCEADPGNAFTDPLYSAQQWVYDMMRVESVWNEGYTGRGVMIRINDPDGVDVTHPELASNFDQAASCPVYLPPTENATHGTAVASLVLGGGNNGQCAVGIAPGATLSVCVGPTETNDEAAATMFLDGLDTTHISVNSWNFDACFETTRRRFLQADCPFASIDPASTPCDICPELDSPDCEPVIVDYCQRNYETELAACQQYLNLWVQCSYNSLSKAGLDAVTKGIQEGRDGKGIIYVFAAGNENDIYEDVNMEGWLNSRYTITVGAVGKDEKHASYSTPGAALFISGPGGDRESTTNNIAVAPGGLCVDATVGTSFAAPSVAGAIALVLEANPSLGWRDVQNILASTARKIDPDNPSWITNGARIHHSNLYGFGMMDVEAAVQAAKSWKNVGPEKEIIVESGEIGLEIPDDSFRSARWAMNVSVTGSFFVESVVVYLQLEHESRGDLEIVLTSPTGTMSVLHPPQRPENRHLTASERWELMTVRNFGEYPSGEWALTLTDRRKGNLGNCIDLDYQFIVTRDGKEYAANCLTIELSKACENGTVLDNEVDAAKDTSNNDRTGRDACCACGGGRPASTVNALSSWRLVIYGHGEAEEGSTSGSPRSHGNMGSASFLVALVCWALCLFV